MRDQRIQHVRVETPQGPSGSLARERDQYVFTYAPGTAPAAAVSLLMPPRAAQYAQKTLHPIFQMNLPEGYVLEQLRQRFAKVTPFDPLLLLALTHWPRGGDRTRAGVAAGAPRPDGEPGAW